MKAIAAHGTIDGNGWLNIHTKVPSELPAGDVEAMVILPVDGRHHAVDTVGAVACLRKIAAAGGTGIKDPVEWQREQRKDRPLPGRG